MADAFARRIDLSVRDAHGHLIRGADVVWYVDEKPVAAAVATDGHTSFETTDPAARISVQARYRDQTQGPVALAADQRGYEFRFSVVLHPRWADFVREQFPAVVGIVFILLTLVLAFTFGDPTRLQTQVMLGTLSLGAGGFAGTIAGMLKTDLSLSQKLTISASGALAVFVIFYFFVPAGTPA